MRPQTFSFSGHYFKEFDLEFLIWGLSLRDEFVIGSTRQDVKKQLESKSESRRDSCYQTYRAIASALIVSENIWRELPFLFSTHLDSAKSAIRNKPKDPQDRSDNCPSDQLSKITVKFIV